MVRFEREPRRKSRHKAGIYSMYVTAAARGQGLGRALMDAALARGRALPGLEQIHLSVVASNIAARQLYLSLGFSAYGGELHAFRLDGQYYDEDLMVLWLA